MTGGPGHDRSKRRERAPGNRAGDRQRQHRRTLQQAAGNQAVTAIATGATPLTGESRGLLEREYEVDLGRVRLHTGSEAANETSAQGTMAFTRGDDVYLGDRAVRDPLVIGHELVHVIQQLRPGAGTAEGDLEAEAASVSAGSSEAIAGGAAFGTVQGFWPFDDEQEEKAQEKQRRDEDAETAVKQRHVLESTEEWKKYVDDPLIGGWLRAHPLRFDPRGENKEFQRWLANPKDRPFGATPTAQPQPPVQLGTTVAPTKGGSGYELQRRGEKTVWKTWTPEQKAMWARSLIEAERRRHIESMTPEKGSFAEALWTVGEETGIHSGMRAYTGENEWGQTLTWGERFSEGVLGAAKVTQTGLMIAGGMPELGEVEAAATAPRYADELLAGAGTETATMLPAEAQAVEQGAQTLGRGGQTVEELAQSTQGKFVTGQDVAVPQQQLFEAPKSTPPSGGMLGGGAAEAEAGGLRLQPQAAPQVVPEAMPAATPAKPQQPLTLTPELAGEAGAAESGWAEAEAQAAKERFAPRPHVPTPVSPAAEVESAKKLARAGAVGAPLIDREPRKFPAAEERPPMKEPEKPPLMIDPERRKEEAKFPAQEEQDEKKLPGEREDEGEAVLAAGAQGKGKKRKKGKADKEIDEAFKEEKGKLDVRKTPPKAEESQPQKREPEMSSKTRESLLAEYEQVATKKIPQIVREILKDQELTPTRKQLAVLKDRFDKLMGKVGDSPKLTAAQRKEAEEILEEARVLAREDFGNVQKAVWRRLRQDPDLIEIEKKLRKTGDVGPGKRALQIPTKRIDESGVEFESQGLEHRVRLSDDPWLYNHPENLLVTDAAQNEQYLEAIRQHGIWPTTETEAFVVRHGLSSQPYDFAPGSRPIPKTP